MFTKHPPAMFSVLLLALLGSVAGAPSGGDFVFPELNELAIGDPCTIEPSPGPKGFPHAREGICQRVRDCVTFIPRIVQEPLDIRRDICYFEVHDPVVCCVDTQHPQYPMYSSEELDYTNLIY